MDESRKNGSKIRGDRQRTNILKNLEYRALEFFCERMPVWITPDLLTAIGFAGSIVIFFGLWLATIAKVFLLLSIIGLAIQWFGDSLDGRLAYYRNQPRKWYGWALDINADWVSANVIGLGFYFYLQEQGLLAYVFVVAYGGSMIVSLLRYKITDKYTIDSFFLGPTELRILLALVLLVEMFRDGTLFQFGLFGSVVLVTFNLIESYRVLKAGDARDKLEKAKNDRKHKN